MFKLFLSLWLLFFELMNVLEEICGGLYWVLSIFLLILLFMEFFLNIILLLEVGVGGVIIGIVVLYEDNCGVIVLKS